MIRLELVIISLCLVGNTVYSQEDSPDPEPSATTSSQKFLSFNFKEIDSIQYEVKITNEPVLKDSQPDQMAMTMTNMFGQKYRCLLPDIGENDGTDASSLLPSTEEGDSSSEGVPKPPPTVLTTENVRTLLAPMAKEPCLIRTKDWWSYELCYDKAVRQFHIEEGRPSGKILVLGNYDHDQDWSETKKSSEDAKVGHHSQFYTNGTLCDLTGGFRRTEIRYVCDPLEVPDRIIRVDEPQSCDYIITVATAKICSISQLRPEEVPKPKEINCSPLFDQQQYDKWLAIKEKRASLYEQKRQAMQKKGLADMLKLVEGEDITDIDVETEEGMTKLEGMVGEKLAENLMGSLNDLIGGGGAKNQQPSQATPQKFKEVELPSGEKKSVPLDQDEGSSTDKPVKSVNQIEPRLNRVLNDFNKFDKADNVEGAVKVLEEMSQELKDIWKELKRTEEEMIRVQELEGDLTNQLISVLGDAEDQQQVMDEIDEGIEKKVKKKFNIEPKEEEKSDKDKPAADIDSQEAEEEEEEGGDEDSNDAKEDKKGVIRVSNIATAADVSHGVRGVANSDSEKRVVKHLENSIKQKIAKSGLEMGGRTIEVKVITAGGGGVPGAAADDMIFGAAADGGIQTAEEKQLQGMVYNLMVGNQQGYTDIDHQRQLENNYKFSLDELSKDTDEQEKAMEPSAAEAVEASAETVPAAAKAAAEEASASASTTEVPSDNHNSHDKTEL